MRMPFILKVLASASLLFSGGCLAAAQDFPRKLLAEADSARLAYDFRKAVDLCEKAAEALDSTKKDTGAEQLIMSQNGLSMMGFCSTPEVVASRVFSLEDFFLFYPLPDKSWRKVPNQLDSLGGDMANATYVPQDATSLFYSTKDENGIRNIYATHLKDTAWSVPTLINEQLTSSSDEIFPMLSPDGKSLYFASKGLFGMGGYDLYVSEWNEENGDWDVPVNMGFPYSSPYDDFLFINTDDGRYSIFASNRDCQRDSVRVYVLEYDGMPVRKAVSDVKELRDMCSLAPKGDKGRIDNGAAVSGAAESAETKLYMEKTAMVRSLRDSIAKLGKSLDEKRARYSNASPDEKASLSEAIAKGETLLPSLSDSLSKASKALQEIEMDFLLKGIVIDTKQLQAAADKEVVGASSAYAFTKNSFGGSPRLRILKPKPSFDYSFKILPEGRFAENNSLPDGLVYQIQITTVSKKATVKDINGLSPVFERINPNKSYTYSVGLFRSYNDVLSNLNNVKRRGFKSAFIVAFHNGKSLSVREARSLEKKIRNEYSVKIFPDNGQSLPETALAAIREHTQKDLVKTVEAGSVVFFAGPFDNRPDAEELMTALKNVGTSNVSIEEIQSL